MPTPVNCALPPMKVSILYFLRQRAFLNSALILHPEQIVGKPSITRVGKGVHEANISQSAGKIEKTCRRHSATPTRRSNSTPTMRPREPPPRSTLCRIAQKDALAGVNLSEAANSPVCLNWKRTIVRKAARERKQERFTAVLHHRSAGLFRDSFYAWKRQARQRSRGTWGKRAFSTRSNSSNAFGMNDGTTSPEFATDRV